MVIFKVLFHHQSESGTPQHFPKYLVSGLRFETGPPQIQNKLLPLHQGAQEAVC